MDKRDMQRALAGDGKVSRHQIVIQSRRSGKTASREIVVTPVEVPLPQRLSLDPSSPDFHPSYVRVGLRIDGEERNDIQFYDSKKLEYMTTAKTSHLATSIEPYWRFVESRQQRRARERWERNHK